MQILCQIYAIYAKFMQKKMHKMYKMYKICKKIWTICQQICKEYAQKMLAKIIDPICKICKSNMQKKYAVYVRVYNVHNFANYALGTLLMVCPCTVTCWTLWSQLTLTTLCPDPGPAPPLWGPRPAAAAARGGRPWRLGPTSGREASHRYWTRDSDMPAGTVTVTV